MLMGGDADMRGAQLPGGRGRLGGIGEEVHQDVDDLALGTEGEVACSFPGDRHVAQFLCRQT